MRFISAAANSVVRAKGSKIIVGNSGVAGAVDGVVDSVADAVGVVLVGLDVAVAVEGV